MARRVIFGAGTMRSTQVLVLSVIRLSISVVLNTQSE